MTEGTPFPAAPPEEETPQENAFAAAYTWLAGLSTAAFVLFAAAVYLMSTHGGALAVELGGKLGDLEAVRARSLAEKGLVDAAIASYTKALSMTFEDPQQRVWALRRFGELLLAEGRTGEALPVLRECLESSPGDLPAHAMLCGALARESDPQPLLNAANAWAEAASRAADQPSLADALNRAGNALEALEKKEEALDTYLRGHAANPKGKNAYNAASLLFRNRQNGRALALLGETEQTDAVRTLRSEIESDLSPAESESR